MNEKDLKIWRIHTLIAVDNRQIQLVAVVVCTEVNEVLRICGIRAWIKIHKGEYRNKVKALYIMIKA